MAKTCAESIAKRYLNEEVEIFMDGIIGRQMYSDYETEEKSIMEGTVLGADGEMLILECVVTTPMQTNKCEVLINGNMIKSIISKKQGLPLLAVIGLTIQHKRKR